VEANSQGAATPPEVWDFCGFNPITTEPFPQPGETENRMRYYWEISHFRREVGDLMLGTMLAGASPGLGRRVTSATLADDLARLEKERRALTNGQLPASNPTP
jgi:hypothetical protein